MLRSLADNIYEDNLIINVQNHPKMLTSAVLFHTQYFISKPSFKNKNRITITQVISKNL